jgi:hypothetical protein
LRGGGRLRGGPPSHNYQAGWFDWLTLGFALPDLVVMIR